ncbi:hypothetical protein EAH_00021620 [Eimeria acervulina]|uniref:Uncharacterized protein n=1 Tax=Eimeria acervulina TaxID=5801 RepID=U6GMI0_EIMAC|nr:hypothetical protein EAH_00021620 [Eimeria acervulina]CDI81421.1 hypothetical protein EAH_00021620 [Eimeria acervulina]
MEGMLCSVGTPAVQPVEVVGRSCEALLDTVASRSFINPRLVEALQLKVRKLSDVCVFTVANGSQSRIDRTVKNLTIWCGRECFTGDYLVGPVPYDIVLGFDWLTKHKAAWNFQSDKLGTYLDGRWCELPLVRAHMDRRTEEGHQTAPKQTPAEEAYDLLAGQVSEMTEAEAAALLYPDASGYAIGGVLEQAGLPIGFLSRAMIPVQQKYSMYDQELLALVSALGKWSHLLRVGKVTAFTDQALTHLRKLQTSKPLRGRTAQWLDFLAEFPDLTITYLQGARNTVADALSRLHSSSPPSPPPSPPTPPLSGSLAQLMLAPAHPDPAHHTRGKQVNYRQLAGIRRRTPRTRPQSPPVSHKANESSANVTEPPAILPVQPADCATLDWPAAYAKCPVFRVPYNTAVQAVGATVQVEFRNRLLAFRFVTPFLSVCIHGLWRICVPQFPESPTHILYNHHDHVTAGHRGQKKTFLSLSKLYYWPSMRNYTTAYAESCTQCRASKALNQKPAGLLQQLIIPSRRWSHVGLDFITDLLLTKTGHDSILVLVESVSKMAHFVPAKQWGN